MPTTYAIPNGRTVFNASTYTGTGTTLTVYNTDNGTTGFKPDMIWWKCRNSGSYNHAMQDSVRGLNNIIFPNSTNGEGNYPNSLDSFNANGFTLGSNSGYPVDNNNGSTYVAWQWQAGQGSNTTNTTGSITSTVSANATAGFSIVTYTGNGATNQTVGHGLSSAPKMIIFKERTDNGYNWPVYHTSLSTGYAIFLNTSGAQDNSVTYWGTTSSPTSTVFGVDGTGNLVNQNTKAYVAYCWAQIAGFSQFGSYVGNNSTDNAFVYTGFRPRYLLIKALSSSGSSSYDWVIYDSVRSTYNATGNTLWADLTSAENDSGVSPKNGAGGDGNIDFLSNGFKIRSSASSMGGSQTYIYACFAENPFKYANAR